MSNATAAITTSGSVTGVSAGTDTAMLTVTNAGGCTAKAIKSIAVKTTPVLSPISGPSGVCKGSMMTLTDTASGGRWISNDLGNATVDSNGRVTGVYPGRVIITYTKSNLGCTSYVRDTITVNAIPKPGVVTGAALLCIGSTGIVTDTSVGVWSMSNDLATISSSGAITAGATSGYDTAILTVTNTAGCSAQAIRRISINDVFPAVADITGGSSVCAGSSITLADTTSGGAWNTNNSSIAVATATGSVVGRSGGVATISYSKTVNGCKTVVTKDITVNVGPALPPIAGLSTTCRSHAITLHDSITGGSWSSVTPSIATVSSSGVVTPLATGTAVIRYAKTIGCLTIITDTITITDCSDREAEGISNTGETMPQVSVYPNPSTGVFVVKLMSLKDNANITIVDINGRTIETRLVPASGNDQEVQFNLNNVARGVYLVEIAAGELIQREKLVIQ